MAVGFSNTNKPINPRGNDQSPKGYNRAALYSGKALDFDGVNDKITIDTDDIDLQEFSVVQYVNLGATAASKIFYSNYAPTGNVGFATGISDSTANVPKFYTKGTSSDTLFGSFALNVGEWYQIVATYDGATKKLYVNGVLDTEVAFSDTIVYTNATNQIGALSPSIAQPLDGQLSNVKVYSTALTAAQVSDLYNNPEKIVPTGVDNTALKLWLPMMEGAGTTAYDGSGNGNHGTISGATYVNGVGSPVAQSAVIDWNKYSITDATDYANVSSTTIANEGTIVFKHVPLASITAGYFTFYGAASTGEGRAIRQNGTKYSFVGFGSSPQDFDTSKNVEVGKITNVAYSWNASGDVKVYIDGVKVGDANKTLYPLTSSSFNINRRVDGIQYHNEIMFYAGLYDEVLTESQIQDIQDGTTNPESVSGLVHFWRNSNNWQDEVGSADLTENDNAGKVLFPQTLTSGRDLAGNIFANVRKQGALNLDGNSWAEVHDNASLDVTTAVTLEAWLKWDGNLGGIIAKDKASARAYNVLIATGGRISFLINGNTRATQASALTLNSWTHVLVTYDQLNAKVFINGAEASSSPYTDAIITTADVVEIGRYFGDSVYALSFPIAQPRIYNRALTAEEVQRNYNAGKNTYTN